MLRASLFGVIRKASPEQGTTNPNHKGGVQVPQIRKADLGRGGAWQWSKACRGADHHGGYCVNQHTQIWLEEGGVAQLKGNSLEGSGEHLAAVGTT